MLRFENVSAGYDGVQVLQQVSFEVAEKESVSIIGANGAGKSTILKVLSGLLHPASGKVWWNGRELTGMPPYEIAALGIAHVPEGRRVFPQLTVEENLEMGSYLPKPKKNRRRSMKRVFGLFPRLEERREQLAGTLSGGEQQMLAIGRALMQEPELLLLDEPSLGLAPVLAGAVFDRLREIHEQGVAMLLVEQNVSQALELSERGYVLENGAIVMEGPSEKLATDDYIQNAYLGL